MIDTNTSPIQDGFVARFRQLTHEAQSRPDVAKQLQEAGRELGIAVSAAIPLIDPEKIAFTGFVVEDDYFFNAVMDELLWYGVGNSAQRVHAERFQNSGEGAPTSFASLSLTMDT